MVSGHNGRKSGRSGGAVSSAFCFRATVQSGITGLPGRSVPAGRRIRPDAGERGFVRDMRPDDKRDRTMQIMRTKQKQNMRNSGADAPGGKLPDGTETGVTRFPRV